MEAVKYLHTPLSNCSGGVGRQVAAAAAAAAAAPVHRERGRAGQDTENKLVLIEEVWCLRCLKLS